MSGTEGAPGREHDAVERVVTLLAALDIDDLLAGYEREATRDLYPGVWNRAEEREIIIDDLAFQFDRLKRFLAGASERRLGVIAYLV